MRPTGRDQETLNRRTLLRIGGLGTLGLTLPGLLKAEDAPFAERSGPPIRSCILIFYYGGPSHLDTWDPKPAAPPEIRGAFRPMATTVPGLRISEHLPRMARLMHKVALIRSMRHGMRNHDSACTQALTGRP